MWKVASITPIHKSGSTKKVENYRPISILNCLAKVLEKIVYDRLYAVNNVDCCSLQMDVNALLHWCESNGMKVHVKKCKVISFSRSRNPLRFDYTMGDGCPLDRVNSIRDLGVTVDRKMKFNEHIALTTGKAFAMLGFLKRNTAHFDDPFALKVLYASLVRSVLEYAAVVWAPYHVTLAARIERVQHELNGIYLTVNRASNDALEEIIDHNGMLSSVDLMQAKMKHRSDVVRIHNAGQKQVPSFVQIETHSGKDIATNLENTFQIVLKKKLLYSEYSRTTCSEQVRKQCRW
ncbi:hypothetical protein pipiens_000242, partial [Culex pipiens pipiens]